ncbi:fish-egg lectin-like [Anomaloglossus baeobatrachus]
MMQNVSLITQGGTMIQILGLLLLCSGAAATADRLCIVIDGRLKQIPGNLSHVTVGQVGVWGVDRDNNIYKLKDNNWVQVSGLMKQVDAGGENIVAGVNRLDAIYCDDKDQTISNSANLAYTQIGGSLKYYSCGPYGCWGANANDDIKYRYDVKPTNCQGSRWQQVDGKLKMVEVGSDGSVYGVNSQGQVYKREGISAGNPIGTSWTQLNFVDTFKHVSYDQGNLWLLTDKGTIYKCKVDGSTDRKCLDQLLQ